MKNLLFLVILLCAPVWAQNDTLFEEGNTAYTDGDYATAIEKYEQILHNGETSADLYYNLGNSYFKANNIAPSIYYFEKALQLNPNDRDIKNNLMIARNMVIDDVSADPETGISGLWKGVVSSLGYNQWGWLAIVFTVFFAALFLLYYFTRKSGLKRTFFSFSMLCIFLALFSLIFAIQQKKDFSNNNYAIIFAQEAVVRGEPTMRSDEIFVLHEGTKVEVLETYQEWIKFELPNGLQGWMDKTDLKFF